MSAIFTQACFEKKKTLESIFLLPCSSISLSSRGSPGQVQPFHTGGGCWSKCHQLSHAPRSAAPSWLGFRLSPRLLSVSLPGSIAISSLSLGSLSSPVRGSALIPNPARSLHPCPLSPDGCQLSFGSGCTLQAGRAREPLSAPGQGRGSPGRGLVLLGNIFLSPPTVISPRSACWCTHNKWQQYYSSSCSCRCLLVIYGYCRERICKHFFTSFLGQNRYSYMLLWRACIINEWSLHFGAHDIQSYWCFFTVVAGSGRFYFSAPNWEVQGFILRSAKIQCERVRLNCLKL